MSKLKPPQHLSTEAKALWKDICADYTIDKAASMILRVTLEAYDRKQEARAAIAKDGATFVDRWGQRKPHPMIAIERDAGLAVLRGFRVLGLDLAQGESTGVYSGGREV
jgi:P27 family predicted phage terminase small subunit